jgi:sodium ion-translocating decarboxylase beta subunit
MWYDFTNAIKALAAESGFANITLLHLIMIVLALFFLYLAIAKKYEPLLLVPIAFGMLLANLPLGGLMHPELWDAQPLDYGAILHNGGLLDLLYLGVKLGIYPPLIFLGIGAMTDFGPLIANPKSLLLGAAAQFGIFGTYIGAMAFGAFTPQQAGSIAIIGGADGPTAIWLTSKLAPELLGPIALAAYSYMALVPVIQPPIMKALTTKKEREVIMKQLRPVSKLEKILFPIVVCVLVILIIPSSAPLVGMLMLGNLFRESGVVERLNDTAQNALINIVTIFLGLTVGSTASADKLSQPGFGIQALLIIGLGLVAFCVGTASGVLFGKLMYIFSGGKINPLIGSAGVSAVHRTQQTCRPKSQLMNSYFAPP